MACFSVTKTGFLYINEIIDDVVNEMTGNVAAGATNSIQYFDIKYSGPVTWPEGANVKILASTVNVDPLANASAVGATITTMEPGWRICFNQLSQNKLAVHAASSIQLTDTGNIARLTNRSTTSVQYKEPVGNVGADWTGTAGTPATGDEGFNQIWLNREPSVGGEAAYPMSYALTMTNRGIFLGIWEDSQEEIPQDGTIDYAYGRSPFRWFLIQRSVDRVTGHVRGGGALRQDNNPLVETSRCPVFCVSGTGAPVETRKFIVRETDIASPSRKKFAGVQSIDNPPLLNTFPQQSLTESGEFIVTFLNNLNTPRFKYSDELDMLGTVSAEVLGAGTQINVDVYDEAHQREYTSLYSTERYGTGMRLVVLTKMGYDTSANASVNLGQNIAVEDSHAYYTP
jgi:hypothetical protein